MIAVAMLPFLLLCIGMAPIAGWVFSLLAAYTMFLALVARIWIKALPERDDAA